MPAHCRSTWLILALACTGGHPPVPAGTRLADEWIPFSATPETVRLEPPARAFALRMSDRQLRRQVAVSLTQAPSLPLTRWLPGAESLVVQVPMAAHRERLQRDPDGPILVAIGPSGLPIAFDPHGGLHRLDPFHPPHSPVLVVERLRQGCQAAGDQARRPRWLTNPGCAAHPPAVQP